MAKYGCVRTDNMSGTTLGKDLVSVVYQSSGVNTAIENGNVVVVGDLKTGEREVRLATAMAANSPLSKLAVIASEEVDKTKSYNNLNEFRNEAGAIARGYRLTTNSVFSVTKEALTGAETPAVGDYVECAAGTKLNVVAKATGVTSGSTEVGTIIAIEGIWYVIQIA